MILSVLLLVAAPDDASLKAFLDAGEKYNLDRRISTKQVQQSAAEFRQAWTALLPTFSASAGWTHNQYTAEVNFASSFQPILALLPPGLIAQDQIDALLNQPPTVIVPKNQLDATLRVDLPIIDVSRWLRAASGSASRDSAEARDAYTLDITRKLVITSYYAYVASLAVVESTQKTLDFALAQQKLVTARRDAGSATELDVARANAEVQRSMQGIADAKSMAATSGRTLRTLTGKEAPATLVLPADDLRPEPDYSELEKQAEGLPQVRSIDSNAVAAERMLWAGRMLLIPTVNGFFMERFTNATGFQNRSALYSLGLTATWRFDVSTVTAFAAQQALTEQVHLNAEKIRLQARDQIHADWQRFNAAITKIKAAEAQVEAARRAASVALARYEAGATTQLELIQATRDSFSADLSQIQARTELAIARGSLRISSGRPLD